MRLWESPITQLPEKRYSIGILLGGDIITYDNATDRLIFRTGADRLLQTIDLYKKGLISKILISGGSGHLLYKDRTEAAFIKKFLVGIGVSPDDIIVENKSRNTKENAKYTIKIIQEMNIKDPALLITSALHMKRAKATFEKQGLNVVGYATSKRTGARLKTFDHLFIPSATTLKNWDLLFHEMIGYGVYKIMGYC